MVIESKKLKLSIIVPFYNVELYIKKCLDSILAQSYQNFQLILVDDGSTDESLKICKEYQKMDNRIEIIQKENGGVVSARKAGVLAATGDFIGWVDGDDWIEPTYFEEMIMTQIETNADIVAVNHFHDIGNCCKVVKNRVEAGVYKKEQLFSTMLCNGTFYEYGITPQLYTKIIRSSIIKITELKVDDNIIAGDDAAVVYPSILMAGKICISNICGYHYIQRQGSITKVENTIEKERIFILIEFLKKCFLKYDILEIMKVQLQMYEKYMLTLRQIEVFDEIILRPFGGIVYGSKVVIYGAGVLGQKIVRYIKKNSQVEIVQWVDQNWKNYRESGFDVISPKSLQEINEKYDYILIANISQCVANEIMNDLVSQGINKEKIRWFTKEFFDA